MKRLMLVSVAVVMVFGSGGRAGHADIVTFRTPSRSHDAKPTPLPVGGVTEARSYARRIQPKAPIYYDTVARTATIGQYATYWYTLPYTTTNTRNFPEFVPGSFPDVPDMWIDHFITETFTVESFRVDVNIFEGEPQPVRITGSTHADTFLPIDGNFTMSQLRGTYRVEGETDSFETTFAVDYELATHTELVKADLYSGPAGPQFAELFPINARFVPVNSEIASVVIDGIDITVSARPHIYQFLVPEPAGGVPWVLAFLAMRRRFRRQV